MVFLLKWTIHNHTTISHLKLYSSYWHYKINKLDKNCIQEQTISSGFKWFEDRREDILGNKSYDSFSFLFYQELIQKWLNWLLIDCSEEVNMINETDINFDKICEYKETLIESKCKISVVRKK